jgi:hypothetical protein
VKIEFDRLKKAGQQLDLSIDHSRADLKRVCCHVDACSAALGAPN